MYAYIYTCDTIYNKFTASFAQVLCSSCHSVPSNYTYTYIHTHTHINIYIYTQCIILLSNRPCRAGSVFVLPLLAVGLIGLLRRKQKMPTLVRTVEKLRLAAKANAALSKARILVGFAQVIFRVIRVIVVCVSFLLDTYLVLLRASGHACCPRSLSPGGVKHVYIYYFMYNLYLSYLLTCW